MRDESVIPGVVHRGVQKAVHVERAGILVQLVLDRHAAHWNLDEGVDLFGRIAAGADFIEIHRLQLTRRRNPTKSSRIESMVPFLTPAGFLNESTKATADAAVFRDRWY